MELVTTSTVFLLLIPLIIWRMYKRIRRLIGRQQSRPFRHWVAVIFLPVFLVLLMFVSLGSPWALAGLAAGVAVGIGLAVWGLRLTQFERTPQGFFYTPYMHIGIAISVLLLMRVSYRLFQMATLTGVAAQEATQNFTRSPWTTVIFGVLAGYYTCYAIGILRWRWVSKNEPVASIRAEMMPLENRLPDDTKK
jgi:hypothetical protein